MAVIRPFKAVRYNKDIDLTKVCAPPYDIISPKEQLSFYENNPYNIVRLDFGLDEEGDNENYNKYTRARDYLNKWLEDGVLVKENEDAIYIYEQQFTLNNKTRSFRGIICLVKLYDFSEKVVLPHEETLSKAKKDRFNLMEQTHANFSQIYSLYLDEEKKVTPIISEYAKSAPDICFEFQNVIQKVWIVKDKSIIEKLREGFSDKQLFIADGHHRYETCLNYKKMMEERESKKEDAPYNYCMMMLVDMDDEGLVVFPTHRIVRGISDFNEYNLIDRIKEEFYVEKIDIKNDPVGEMEEVLTKNSSGISFVFYTGHSYFYLVKLKDVKYIDQALPQKPKSYRHLDVTVLHTLIMEKCLGIDKENMAGAKNLLYTRDIDEAVKQAQSEDVDCVFLLNATKIHQIKDVSLDNEKMPQKSTYFYPKLVTGIVMYKFD